MSAWKAEILQTDLYRWCQEVSRRGQEQQTLTELLQMEISEQKEILRYLSRENLGLPLKFLKQAKPQANHFFVSAMALGLMESSLEQAWAYAEKREQGGKHIIEWSLVAAQLGDLLLRLKMLSLIYKNSESTDNAWPACLYLLEKLPAFVSECMQIFGGAGYIRDYPMERKLREAYELCQQLSDLSELKAQFFLDERKKL